MRHYKILESSIVISPLSRQWIFLDYRNEYPEDDMILLTVEDLEKLFLYEHDDRAIRYLLSLGKGFHEAKDMLKAMAYINLDKTYRSTRLNYFKALVQEMVKLGYLYKDEYAYRMFAGRNIIIDGYPDGTRISRALDSVPNISMSWLGNDIKKQNKRGVARFSNIYGELHYLCNCIAKDIDEGISPERIFISGYNEEYRLPLSLLANAYGFRVDLPSENSMFETSLGRELLAKLNELETIDEASVTALLNELHEQYAEHERFERIVKILFGYLVPTLDKARQIEIYAEALKEIAAPCKHYEGSIGLLDEEYPLPDMRIYRINLVLDNAPRIIGDDDFLFDEEKAELGMMTSMMVNQETKARQMQFLLDPSVVSISYHVRHLNNEKNPSSYIGNGADDPLFIQEHDDPNNPYIEYSLPFAKIWGGHLLDNYLQYKVPSSELEFLRKKHIVRGERYDNSFIPFADSKIPPESDIQVSASSLDTLYKCPFHYYCTYLLKIDDFESTFSALIGTIFHEALSHAYEEGYDPKSAYDQAITNQEELRGEKFSIKERVILENLFEGFFLLDIKFINDHHQAMLSSPSAACEPEYLLEFTRKVQVKKHLYLKGSADKIILTKTEEKEYATFIDYKTYSKSFRRDTMELGFSLQLPIYAYLASKLPEFSGKTPLGLFIGPIMPGHLWGDTEKNHNAVTRRLNGMKLEGTFLLDVEGLQTLDSQIVKSDFVSGLNYGKNGFPSNNKHPITKETMGEIIQKAEEKILEAEERIRSGNFPIFAISVRNGEEACTYCPFRDVCYRTRDQMIEVTIPKEGGTSDGEAD